MDSTDEALRSSRRLLTITADIVKLNAINVRELRQQLADTKALITSSRELLSGAVPHQRQPFSGLALVLTRGR